MRRFVGLRRGARLGVVVASLAAAGLAFLAASFLLLVALFSRSIHGPPPPLVVWGAPFLAAIAVGGGVFAAACRWLADGRR